MTKNISELTSPAACLFAKRCMEAFPVLHENIDFFRVVERVFQYSFVRYMYSDLSFIRQLHISAFPGDDRHIAVIYLMFSDGQVQGIKLTGNSMFEAANVCAIADEIERLVHSEESLVDANEGESRLISLLAQKKRVGLVISAFHHESFKASKESLTIALNSICHVLARAIQAKTKLDPTEIGTLHTLVTESFPAFSIGGDKLDQFAKYLDADVVEAITELERVVNVDLYEKFFNFNISFHRLYPFNQLYPYNYFTAGDPILKRRRIQAISAFPWMAPFVMEYWHGLQKFSSSTNFDHALSSPAFCHWGQQLSEAVDAGRPLISTAATLFRVNEEVIEWSTGRPIIFQAPPSLRRINDLLRVLSFIKRENRPNNTSCWFNLRATLRLFVLGFRFCVDDGHNRNHAYNDDEGIAELLAMPNMQQILRKRFEELNQRKSSIFKAQDWLFSHFCVAEDFLATLCDAVKARYVDDKDTESTEIARSSTILMAWQAEHTLRDIANISWRWYCELREELALSRDDSDVVWPIALEKPFEFDELRIVQMANYQQLNEEVRTMHCDAFRYVNFYLLGTSQLFSIRNSDNVRLSTLELKSNLSDCDVDIGFQSHIEIASHHGFNKSKPSDLCKKAATALIGFLNARDCAKLFDDFSHVATANHFRKKEEVRKRNGAIANFDIVAEAIAWRCAFSSEKKAKSFFKRFH